MPFAILTAFSVACCYCVHKDAAARGMSAARWSIAVLLTSGLALPLYLSLRQPKR